MRRRADGCEPGGWARARRSRTTRCTQRGPRQNPHTVSWTLHARNFGCQDIAAQRGGGVGRPAEARFRASSAAGCAAVSTYAGPVSAPRAGSEGENSRNLAVFRVYKVRGPPRAALDRVTLQLGTFPARVRSLNRSAALCAERCPPEKRHPNRGSPRKFGGFY